MRKISELACWQCGAVMGLLLLVVGCQSIQLPTETRQPQPKAPVSGTLRDVKIEVLHAPKKSLVDAKTVDANKSFEEQDVHIASVKNVSPSTASRQNGKTLQHIDLEAVSAVTKESVEGSSVTVSIDSARHASGKASLKVQSQKPGSHHVVLARLENLNIKGVQRLAYRAQTMTQDLQGEVYLLMSVYVQGEMPQASMINGFKANTFPKWNPVETAFFLKPGQTIGQLELALVLDGPGTVWVDDLSLLSGK